MKKSGLSVSERCGANRLSDNTHVLADQALSGQWGREIKPADFALPTEADSVSMNMKYAMATKLAAEKAPVWIKPNSLIVGSSTLDEGRRHLVPLLGKTLSISHTTIGFDKSFNAGL